MSDNDDSISEQIRSAATELKEFYDELRGESPRAAAILAVASLEDEIERLVRSRFPEETSNRLWNKIAGPGFTPLGSLKAKADMAQAFGFFGPKTRSTIEGISAIRNKFAHKPGVRNFDHPLVLSQCKKLADNPFFPAAIADNSPATHVRWFYIHTVQILEERLAAIRERVPELDGSSPDPLP